MADDPQQTAEKLKEAFDRLQQAHRSGEQVQEAAKNLRRRADSQGVPDVAAECLLLQSKNLRDHGSPYQGLQSALEARRRIMPLGKPKLEMSTHNVIGEILWTLGEMTEARKVIQYAAERANTLGLETHHARMLARLALTFDFKDEPEEYVRRNREALDATRALDSPDRTLRAIVLGNLGNGLIETGELDQAEEAFEASLELGDSLDDNELRGLATLGLAEVYAARGQVETWTDLAGDALELLDHQSSSFELIRNVLDLVERAIEHGSSEAALSQLDSLQELVEARTFLNLRATFHELRARALEQIGDLAGALGSLRESKEWQRRHHEESIAQLRRPLDTVVHSEADSSNPSDLLEELARVEEARRQMAAAAYTDPLTQLPNRRAFDRRAPEEFRNSGQDDAPLAMAILDLDHFKDVNDEHGHLVGDDALRRVADRIEDAVRSTDFVARLGGEEFAIIMPETSDSQARKVAQRIRRGLEEIPVLTGKHRVEVTASVGVAARWDDDTLDTLLQRADEALYLAKERGRNRVELLEDSG